MAAILNPNKTFALSAAHSHAGASKLQAGQLKRRAEPKAVYKRIKGTNSTNVPAIAPHCALLPAV